MLPDETTLADAVSLPVDDAPPAPETLPGLAEVRDDAAAHAMELPAADWDVDALASALSFDPEQAYEFVRDRIGFDPYEGVLRGAEGTLAARAGNALDRALLLAALLDAMGVEHRFALAELDDASVDRVLERALAAPVEPLPTPGLELTALDASAIATRATRDYARLREALGDRVDAIHGVRRGGAAGGRPAPRVGAGGVRDRLARPRPDPPRRRDRDHHRAGVGDTLVPPR